MRRRLLSSTALPTVPAVIAGLAVAGLLGAAVPAAAHPHVWVVGTTEVLFDGQGQITGLRHHWSFDEMYSAFATQGLAEKGNIPTTEQLAPLAKTNVESLAEFGYFTSVKEGGRRLELSEPRDYEMTADAKGVAILHFTVPLKTPTSAKKPFSFQTYDPTYFVSFSTDAGKAATLVGAPAGCSLSALEPPPLLAADEQKLNAAKADNFSPGADLSIRLATRVIVACP